MTPSFESPERPLGKRAFEVDMSPKAVDQRLRDLGQLYEFGKTLRTVRFIGPIEPKHSVEELQRMIAEYEEKQNMGRG